MGGELSTFGGGGGGEEGGVFSGEDTTDTSRSMSVMLLARCEFSVGYTNNNNNCTLRGRMAK